MTELETPVLFSILEGKFCVAKSPPGADLGSWRSAGPLCAIAYTDEEVSIVCQEDNAPPFAEIERSWRCLKVQGPLEFALKGVLLSLLRPLAEAGIGVYVTSTYDTDYILVKQHHLQKAIAALEAAGHRLIA